MRPIDRLGDPTPNPPTVEELAALYRAQRQRDRAREVLADIHALIEGGTHYNAVVVIEQVDLALNEGEPEKRWCEECDREVSMPVPAQCPDCGNPTYTARSPQ